MARYTGPSCRQCRREGAKLFLKGTKCFTEKCPVERRPYAPGQHGQATARRKKDDLAKRKFEVRSEKSEKFVGIEKLQIVKQNEDVRRHSKTLRKFFNSC